jgi:hypothetical protein
MKCLRMTISEGMQPVYGVVDLIALAANTLGVHSQQNVN